jgi:diguanylate cyclase (GGDEF)-like protein
VEGMNNKSNNKDTLYDLLHHYHDLLTQPENLFSKKANVQDVLQSVEDENVHTLHRAILKEIITIKEKTERLSWMSEHLKVLHELGQSFTQAINQEQIYKKAHELVSRVMPTDAFIIAFYEEGSEFIQMPYAIDNGEVYQLDSLRFGEGNISKVITTKETVHHQTQKDLMSSSPGRWGNENRETSTAIFVPVLLGNQIKGVISAQSYREFAYLEEHEELLRIIGFQMASAIETRRLYDQLYKISIEDGLTGLNNYRAFHQDFDQLLTKYKDDKITLIMIDSDNLKKVNDQYGHHMGDLLIKRIGQAIKAALDNESEKAYRYAGDEFMILCPQSSIEKAEEKVKKVTQYLVNNPIYNDGIVIATTVSAGIAIYPDHGKDVDTLKQAADIAMYKAKTLGKNQVSVYRY